MAEILNSFGRLPKGKTVVEDIASYKWDTIVLLADGTGKATIKPEQLFLAPKKNEILQNEVLPINKGKAYAIKFAKVTTNLVFDSKPQVNIFEQFSRIQVIINNVVYSDIALAHLLPYNRIAVGSINDATTPVTEYNTVFAKDGTYVKLPIPIEIPEQADVKFTFVPGGADIKTADVDDFGAKFGTSVVTAGADPTAFYIKFEFVGTELRERNR